ncbi:hypothetical protein CEP45_04040 [Mergibacter septicus]|uniref:hypothetical protein n=1 Tax=Mergibacter septicus TaxID=221402 RepID=UPI001C7807AF|nr:hypothetical protein [Mergibacter septicus]QDJ13071.1 hypothetical protein CEP45_04040 [Mergibacter septicus]
MATYYKQAPLPFIGQKRKFLNHFIKVLNDNIPEEGKGWTIVDAFGGSGLLSHVAKHCKPNARVIFNDYDGYAERLQHIDDINKLRQQLYDLLKNYSRKKTLTPDLKKQVINIIQNFNGFKDARVISSWLLFSGKQVKDVEGLFNQSFFNRVRLTDYTNANDYFNGFEIVRESFHKLLPQFQDDKKTLFVLDPPYLCTAQASYKQERYFDLIDFLRLVDLTRQPYIFFSSTKSEFLRFIDWLVESKKDNWQSFENAKRISINAKPNHKVVYEDNLVYKF